jgi:WD40 repeat protein
LPASAPPPDGVHELPTDALATGPGPTPAAPPEGARPWRFGNYELLGEVARGGMGVVYKARLVGAERVVALKMVLAGDFAAPGAVDRFRAEARAAAGLDHPGIVPLYDIGEAEGRPYFTMPLVEGGSLQQLVARGPLPAKLAAGLVRQLAEAVQYAHDRGVVHRDLKPANVLLQRQTAGGDADATRGSVVPRLTDFGLARAVAEGEGLTATAQVLGTPGYMAPEQAAGSTGEVGPRADVYGLGAVLYCLLTGRPPFQAATPLDTLVQVREEDPVPPRRLNPQVPADLETVCLRCLEKSPARRYPTARALAEELGRFEVGLPVLARPVGRLDRGWRWCRRNPAQATAVATAAASLVLGTAAAAAFAFRAERNAERADLEAGEARRARDNVEREAEEARRQKEAAQREQARADRLAYTAQIGRAASELEAGDVGKAAVTLDGTRWDLRGWEYHYLRRRADGTPLVLRGHLSSVRSVAWSPDGSRLATASHDGTARVWDARSGQELLCLKGHTSRVQGVAWSPDGSRLATASQDGTARVWDALAGKESLALTHPGTAGKLNGVEAVAFSPDGSRLSTATQQQVHVWDVATGRVVTNFPRLIALRQAVFSPDGGRVATCSFDGTPRVWDAHTGREALVLGAGVDDGAVLRSIAFSPDGTRLAAGSDDGPVRFYDTRTGKEALPLRPRGGSIFGIAFSPDGSRLATASADGAARVWDARTGEEARVVQNQPTNSLDGTIRLWDDPRVSLAWRASAPVTATAFSPRKGLLATAHGASIHVWDLRTERQIQILETPERTQPAVGPRRVNCRGVGFNPDGTQLFGVLEDGSARVWNVSTGQKVLELTEHNGAIWSVAWSPDGARLATATGEPGKPGVVRVWNTRTGRLVLELKGHRGAVGAVCWSPDGGRLATASDDRTARVWDVRSGQRALVLGGHGSTIQAVAWSPDGARLATASDETVQVWDAHSGRQALEFRVPGGKVQAVFWSPGGERLATASYDNTAQIWDARTGEEVLAVRGHTREGRVVFSPDWDFVATVPSQGSARLSDTRTGPEALVLRGHTEEVRSVAFSPDSRRIASRDAKGVQIVWDAITGRPLPDASAPADVLPGPVSPDGRFEALAVGQLIWLLPRKRDTGGYDPWAEDEARRRAWAPAWHAEDAEAARRADDWFATAFHLGRLLLLRPGDPALWRRRAEALRRLGQPDLAALHDGCARLLGRADAFRPSPPPAPERASP